MILALAALGHNAYAIFEFAGAVLAVYLAAALIGAVLAVIRGLLS